MPLKLLSTSDTFLKAAAEFNDTDNNKDSIIQAGESAVTQLYKTGFQGSLNQLRIEQFEKKVMLLNACKDMEKYPPTSSSCIQHSLRVYHQIMEWEGYKLNPLEWGFTIQNNTMMPIMTTTPIAPELVFNNLHCKCTTGCKNMRCTCRKLGLP